MNALSVYRVGERRGGVHPLLIVAILLIAAFSATGLFAADDLVGSEATETKLPASALEANINSIPVVLPEAERKEKLRQPERIIPKSTSAPEMEKGVHNVASAGISSTKRGAQDVSQNNTTTDIPLPGRIRDKVTSEKVTTDPVLLKNLQIDLDLAKTERRQKGFAMATRLLVGILETNAPVEIQRSALYELALVAQDDNQLVKAQQIFGQYLRVFPDDPSVPEVLLRQGLLYRQMGATTMAVGKFYSVMSSSLRLKLDNMDYYKKLVLQAQMEIAETYYVEGKFVESADYFGRLLKSEITEQDKTVIQYKLIRSLANLPNHSETIARAKAFIEQNPNSAEIPEVRFLLASTLKKVGQNQESMKQVLALLQSQEENAKRHPETWIYWQQRAGNDIANQLYKEGDYFNALQIYQSLSELDKSPAWQLPVWYQIGLVYEQLQQPQKARDIYSKILARKAEITDTNSSPSLLSLLEMAKWRNDYMDWVEKSRVSSQNFQRSPIGNQSPVVSK
jgi:tetratricopeptide (TPR) repeat protein